MLKNQTSVPVLDVDYGIREKMTRVLRESPFDRLRVVRELEPQDPEGNRRAKLQSMSSSEKIGIIFLCALGVLARKIFLNKRSVKF